ncbi:MAG: porin family protein [Saprospiraceae bacterium]|nr:porin family protein [Saprospiraceae bacterium]
MKPSSSFLFASVMFLAGLCSLNAQMTDGRPRIGFKAGVNGSSLYDDANASDKKSRLGITGGIFAQVPFVKGRMALRPELLFATKGGAYDFANGDRSDFKINYIELPISLEYRLLGFVNLHAGGYAALLASADGTIEGIPGTLSKADFEEFDFGWHAGGGIDFGGLGLHFRLSRGLQKLDTQSAIQLFGDLKNSAWAVTLSYGL